MADRFDHERVANWLLIFVREMSDLELVKVPLNKLESKVRS